MSARAALPEAAQPSLPLPGLADRATPPDPASDEALRCAYTGAGLARHGISFAEAMATDYIARALRCTAEAMFSPRHRARRA